MSKPNNYSWVTQIARVFQEDIDQGTNNLPERLTKRVVRDLENNLLIKLRYPGLLDKFAAEEGPNNFKHILSTWHGLESETISKELVSIKEKARAVCIFPRKL